MFEARRQGQERGLVETLRRDDGDDARLAFGQCPGLVDHERVDPLEAFQGVGVLDQDPAAAPLPIPTMIDMGVASPSAQGHATIRTETAATSA